ncbi:unnamed protein product [Penicillium bialowiezense]
MEPQQPRKRRRIARSCIECARRKIKGYSSNPTPLVQHPENTFGPRASGPSLSVHGDQVGGSKSALDANALRDPPTPATRAPTPVGVGAIQVDIGTAQTRPGQRPSPFGQIPEPDLAGILSRIETLEKSSTNKPAGGLSETNQAILGRPSHIENSEWIFSKTRIMRWSLWMGTAKEFAPFLACYTEAVGKGTGEAFQAPETRAILCHVGDLLKQCKDIARTIKVWRPSRSLLSPQIGFAPPPRELADMMTGLYFEAFESVYRILHIPSFWVEYDTFWSNPEQASISLRLKILLVVGIGSSIHEKGMDAGYRPTIHRWVYAAQAWLSGPLEKDRLSISALQIDCLTILARQIYSIGADLVWTSMGTLLHKAMQINLHRDPKHLSGISVLQTEVRRRLWATIVEMTVQAALDSAMPSNIPEADTEPPSNINDDEISEFATAIQSHSSRIYTATSLQLLMLKSLPVRLRILHTLTSLSPEISYLDVIALSSELTNAFVSNHGFMKENSGASITPFHRNLLDYLIRRFMMPLHCPFTDKARTNPLLSSSLKATLEAAMAIMSPEPDDAFSRLMAIGGGVFREGIWCAMTVISIELLGQTEAQSIDGTLHRNHRYIGLLKSIATDMLSLSVERIRQGETNIKGHMFMSMIIAQVEAKQSGADSELSIAQSAKSSLEFCRDLLMTVADTISLGNSSDGDFGSGASHYGDLEEPTGLDLDLDWDFLLPDAGLA